MKYAYLTNEELFRRLASEPGDKELHEEVARRFLAGVIYGRSNSTGSLIR